jgi:hypothetical protein
MLPPEGLARARLSTADAESAEFTEKTRRKLVGL